MCRAHDRNTEKCWVLIETNTQKCFLILQNNYTTYKKTQYFGGCYGGGTPVPIPNTEVKSARADDSRKAKVGSRQNSVFFYFVKK